MKALKLLVLAFFVVILNSFYKSNPTADIEGLWITTEETSAKFAHGTQKVAIQIRQNQDGELTARGIFIWDGDYQSEWNLVDIEYDNLAHCITINDTDGDTYKGIVDVEKKKITGAVHLRDNKKDTLNFIPADKHIVTKLFSPRIPDKNGEVIYSYEMPEQLDDGLQTASINNNSVDSESIKGLINDIINQEYGRLESLLVLKDNTLIVEEYFYGYDRTQLHRINSCTKSITSLLLGIALEQHKSMQVDQPIFDFFPEYDSLITIEKEQITLEHVLTMTAGFQWDETPKEMWETNDQFQYILSRPMESKPGKEFLYNSGCSILLGGVINYLESKHANVYAEEVLFGPMEISEYIWKTHENGTAQCDRGLSMLPRDLAKIGLLVLNDGKWQNKQLVSEEWICESTKPRVPQSEFSDYGYQWWHRSKQNKSWWKDPVHGSKNEHDMIIALGAGGQYIMVVRDQNMVIVTTSSDNNEDNGMAFQKIPMVIEEIVPAITNTR